DLTECFRTFRVEPECDFPSFLTVAGSRLRNMVAAEICFLSDEQTLFDRLAALNFLFISFDPVFWRNHFLSFIDRFQSLTVVRIHKAELKLGNSRQLLACFLDVGSVETRDLHENTIVALWRNNRFAYPKAVHTLADSLDGLIHHRLCNWPFSSVRARRRLQPNQKRSANFKVDAEMNLAPPNHRPIPSLLVEWRISRP